MALPGPKAPFFRGPPGPFHPQVKAPATLLLAHPAGLRQSPVGKKSG